LTLGRGTGARDFAFSAARDVVWYAMPTIVSRRGAATLDTVLVQALSRPRMTDWRRTANHGRQSIDG